MDQRKFFAACPEQLWMGEPPLHREWRRDDAQCARMDRQGLGTYQLAPMEQCDEFCRPVYRQHESSSLAVATGAVFVRLAKSLPATELVKHLRPLGLHITELPAWAPNAAWVAGGDNQPCLALTQMSRIQDLPGVVHVEPQFLMEARSRRG
jgi:hypothetical protein